MVDLLVRNIDAKIAARLRRQAQREGVSAAEQVRRILAAHLRPSRAELIQELREFRAGQKPHRTSAVDLIREDRDR
jgi:plasmid stability protein